LALVDGYVVTTSAVTKKFDPLADSEEDKGENATKQVCAVSDAVLQCLEGCPVDSRSELLQNIYIAGDYEKK
jgi:actin-related protein